MSTIYDVAKLAGVSKTTVSKILGGNQNVRAATLEKVNRAMKELEYVPSCFAQGMRKSETKLIAVLLPEQYNYGYMEILSGIEACARKNGYATFVCSTGTSGEYEEKYLKEAVFRKADAIIYFSYRRSADSLTFLEKIAKKTAVVVMDNVLRGEALDVVRVNGFELTQQATALLAAQGCKKIAYIKGKSSFDATVERYLGYVAGVNACGLCFDSSLVKEADFTLRGGYAAARELFSQQPDAILAATDMLALGALDCAKDLCIDVPMQTAIVGFDDIALCDWSRPRLSSLSQNQKELGEAAVCRIMQRIETPTLKPQEILLSGKISFKETTK